MSGPLLEVRDLGVRFVTPDGTTTGLDGVSLEVGHGEILGVVGETGCGKTLTGLSILGLLPATAKVSSGSIRLDGTELLGLPERTLRQHSRRGGRDGVPEPRLGVQPGVLDRMADAGDARRP